MKGLRLLAKGSDPDLREVAKLELSMPEEDRLRKVIADRYLELAPKSKGAAEEALRSRAAEWYEDLAGRADGFSREAVVRQWLRAVARVWLADLPESDVKARRFKKRSEEVTVDEFPCPNGIAMRPEEKGPARVSYRLHKDFEFLSAAVAHSDDSRDQTFTFKVLGDGELLWRSRPLKKGQMEDCTVSIHGADVLELVADVDGWYWTAQAVWLRAALFK